jgi:acid phosphatase
MVVGHHPIRTGGKHGENQNLVHKLKPILDRNDVNLYFAGHDHDLQLLKDDQVHYAVSGGGSSMRKVNTTPYTLFSKSSLGFVLGSVNKETLHLYFINERGLLLFSKVINK